MFTLFKWTVVNAAELSETFFQNDAVIEALETKLHNAQTIIDNQRKEMVTQNAALLEAQNEAAQVPVLQEQITELEKEVLQLQKATFIPLPDAAPVKNKGGRPRKRVQEEEINQENEYQRQESPESRRNGYGAE